MTLKRKSKQKKLKLLFIKKPNRSFVYNFDPFLSWNFPFQ